MLSPEVLDEFMRSYINVTSSSTCECDRCDRWGVIAGGTIQFYTTLTI